MSNLLSKSIQTHIDSVRGILRECDDHEVERKAHLVTMIGVYERWQNHALNMESKLQRIAIVLPAQMEISFEGTNIVQLTPRRRKAGASWPA